MLKIILITVVTATMMSFGAVIMSPHDARADGGNGGRICLSVKSETYAYLEAIYLNWGYVKFINRGHCSTDTFPGHYLTLFSPGVRYHCYDQWGRVYLSDKYYTGSNYDGAMLTCYKNTGSW